MGTYGNGEETKRQIIRACKKLFLEKGYSATTFLDICKEAHVNQGSIYYHFKEKLELFRMVADSINEENREVVRQVMPPGTPEYMHFLMDMYVYWYRFYTDDQFRRFMDTPGSSPYGDPEQYYDYWQRCSTFIPNFDQFFEEHTLDFITCTGIDRQMTTYVAENMEKYTWQELAEYQVRAITAIFRYSPEKTDRILEEIRQILKTVDFSKFFHQNGGSAGSSECEK